MKYLLHYLEKKNILIVFALITFHQILNALVTYTLAKAGLSFQNRQHFALWVLSSILLFVLSPAINILIRRYESELSFTAYKLFLQEALFSKSGNSTLWQSKNLKDRFLASIGSDASDYLGLVLFISMDIYSFVLSVVLGVLTLSLTIDMSLLPAFTVSGILSFLVYRGFSKKVENLYNADQSARTLLGSHLLKSWDNVLLKNSKILSNYTNGFNERISTSQLKAIKSVTASELLIFLLGLMTGFPVMVSVCWILWNTEADTQILIALLATLPRQLNILGVFRNIFQSLTSLLGVQAKFEVISDGTRLPERVLTHSIKATLITLNNMPVKNLEDILNTISQTPRGRIEVRGPNGAGKSTLLLHLNHQLPASMYIPTHPDLMIETEATPNRSSGENLLAHISILRQSREPVILLDEWDANLDGENLININTLIDELAQTKTVIEVRHR